jgi:hypothetical protein
MARAPAGESKNILAFGDLFVAGRLAPGDAQE